MVEMVNEFNLSPLPKLCRSVTPGQHSPGLLEHCPWQWHWWGLAQGVPSRLCLAGCLYSCWKPWARELGPDRWSFMELLPLGIFTVWHIFWSEVWHSLLLKLQYCIYTGNKSLICAYYRFTVGIWTKLTLPHQLTGCYLLAEHQDRWSFPGWPGRTPLRQMPLSAVLTPLFLRVNSLPRGTTTDSSLFGFIYLQTLEGSGSTSLTSSTCLKPVMTHFVKVPACGHVAVFKIVHPLSKFHSEVWQTWIFACWLSVFSIPINRQFNSTKNVVSDFQNAFLYGSE